MSTTAPLIALLAIFLIVFGTIVFVVRRFESTPVRVAAIVSAIATLIAALAPITRLLMESQPEPEADQILVRLVRLVVIVAIYLIVFGTTAYVVDRLKSRPARAVAVLVGIGTLIGSLTPVVRAMSEPATRSVAVQAVAAERLAYPKTTPPVTTTGESHPEKPADVPPMRKQAR
ncbi:hypothetical protein [Streptomyces sp. LaBMicrA B280]|uniref:hypothetical protein n=1 Tax=Streptomyces sp. LaBMicrA B280 TaxID=3391001 RepID=UPI003BA6864E